MDAIAVSTRTIWVAAAVLFGIAVIASAVSGSPILAIILVLVTIGCVVASRRAPADDGGRGRDTDDQTRDQDEDEADDEDDD